MKRIIFEVILALALAGAGAFGWTSWKQNQSATGQITALKAASEAASKAAADKAASVKAAEDEMAALRAEMAPLEGQAQQLAAVKAAMANGTTLTDLEAAYKAQKKLSAERQVGLGAVRMLTKGADDPATLAAFRKALEMSELGDRKNTICAAQIGLAAAGEKVSILPDCLPKGAKSEAAQGDKSDLAAPQEKAGEKDEHGKPGDKKSPEKHAVHWSYDGDMGPERWGKEFPTCAKGKSQSPLDIRGPFVKTRTVVTADYKEGPLKLLNNGHTIQVNANPGSKLRIDGVAYDLLQFHFHRPSEEKIDGKPMAMVAHFVHKSKAGKLAVIGVLLKEGKDNEAINVLWDNAPAKEGPEAKLDKISFDPGKLIPAALAHYAYEGSLTTPPCTEGVNFYILKTPVDISKAQVAKFPFKMNARPVQPLNGRKIGAN